jgi:hypothetical protein
MSPGSEGQKQDDIYGGISGWKDADGDDPWPTGQIAARMISRSGKPACFIVDRNSGSIRKGFVSLALSITARYQSSKGRTTESSSGLEEDLVGVARGMTNIIGLNI